MMRVFAGLKFRNHGEHGGYGVFLREAGNVSRTDKSIADGRAFLRVLRGS